MLILPAMDLLDGRCVRLLRGAFESATFYDGAPETHLAKFAAAGAQWAHIVDLDGARLRRPRQYEIIGALAERTGLKIQAAGGVRRDFDVARLLDAGVKRVVIGSMAIVNPKVVRKCLKTFGPERICLAFDVRFENLAPIVVTHGWTAPSQLRVSEAIAQYAEDGLRHVMVTDVDRDGALAGPNLQLMEELVRMHPELEIQASGGVRDMSDIDALEKKGAAGVIVGKAFYEGELALEEAFGARA